MLQVEQREFLLSVALEYQLVGFLSRCAAEWVDGSQSAMGCTLPALLKWGWQRATNLKNHADNLCKSMDFMAKLSDLIRMLLFAEYTLTAPADIITFHSFSILPWLYKWKMLLSYYSFYHDCTIQ